MTDVDTDVISEEQDSLKTIRFAIRLCLSNEGL